MSDEGGATATDGGIRVERRGDIDVVTIDRPQSRNALTLASFAALRRAVLETSARCLVITGAGTAFCSGDDVRQVMGGGDRPPPVASPARGGPRLTPAADALLHTDVPVIAAVNGAAVGWGMELSLLADLRVASDRARFGELFVLRGLVTDVAGLGRLAALVGRERAAELLFTGEVIDADEARRIGLVGRVVSHDELLPADTAIGIRKGNDEFKTFVNKGIAAIHADGTYDKIQKKYFGDLNLYDPK